VGSMKKSGFDGQRVHGGGEWPIRVVHLAQKLPAEGAASNADNSTPTGAMLAA
jgi:hypothetical protein